MRNQTHQVGLFSIVVFFPLILWIINENWRQCETQTSTSSSAIWIIGGNHEFQCSPENYLCGDTAYVVLDFNQKDTIYRDDTLHHALGLNIPMPNDGDQVYIERIGSTPMGELNITVHIALDECENALDSSTYLSSDRFENDFKWDWIRRENCTYFFTYQPEFNETCTLRITRPTPLEESTYSIPDLEAPFLRWKRGLAGIKYEFIHNQFSGRSWNYQLTTNDTSIRYSTNKFVQVIDSLPQEVGFKAISEVGIDSLICLSDSKEIQVDLNDLEFAPRHRVKGKIELKEAGCNSSSSVSVTNEQVYLTNGSDHFYTYTDETGQYEIKLPTGDYRVSIFGLDSLSGIQACRNSGTIQVAKSNKTTFKTNYTTDNSCSHIQIEAFPYAYSYESNEEIDISFIITNTSHEEIIDLEIPITIPENAEILSTLSPNLRKTDFNKGIIEISSLGSGENILLELKVSPTGRLSEFKGKVRVEFDLESINHCYRNDILSRYIQWHEESSDIYVFTSTGTALSTKDLTLENFMSTPQVLEEENTIEAISNLPINPQSVRLLNNSMDCAQAEILAKHENQITLIQDCTQPSDINEIVGFKFQALEPNQKFDWKTEYKMKRGFSRKYDLRSVQYSIDDDSIYTIKPATNWKEAPIICDIEMAACFILADTIKSELQYIIDSNGKLQELKNAFWFVMPGTGEPIDMTIKTPFGCGITIGVLEGHPEKWNWVSDYRHLVNQRNYTFETETKTNYYWVLEFDDLWCGIPELSFSPQHEFNYNYPSNIQVTNIYGPQFPGGSIEICTDIDVDHMPTIRFSTQDTVIYGLSTRGCIEYLVKDRGIIDYNISAKYGMHSSLCGDSLNRPFDMVSEDRSEFVILKGRIFNARDTLCDTDTILFNDKTFEVKLTGMTSDRQHTDSLGNYQFILKPGEYEIDVLDDQATSMDLCSQIELIKPETDTVIDLGVTSANFCPNLNLRIGYVEDNDILPNDKLIREIHLHGTSSYPTELIIEVVTTQDILIDSISVPNRKISDSVYHIRTLIDEVVSNYTFEIYLQVLNDITLERNELRVTRIFPECNSSVLDPANTFTRADTSSCQGAKRICLENFTDSLVNINTGFPLHNLCPDKMNFPGEPHFVTWYEFYTADTNGTIIITTDLLECDWGNGIQAGLFEGTCARSRIIDCNAECNDTIVLSGSFSASKKYYFWVDGCNGDLCTYDVKFNIPIACNEIFRDRSIEFEQIDLCGERNVTLQPPNNRIKEAELKWIIESDTISKDSLDLINPNRDTIIVLLTGIFQSQNLNLQDTLLDTIILDTAIHSGYLKGILSLKESCDSSLSIPFGSFPLHFVSTNFEYHTFSDSNGQFEVCLSANEYLLNEDILKRFGLLNCDSTGILISNMDTTNLNIVLSGDPCARLNTSIRGLRRFRCNAPNNQVDITIHNQLNTSIDLPNLFVDVDTFLRIDTVIGSIVDSFVRRGTSLLELYLKDISSTTRQSITIAVLPNCDDGDLGKPFCIKSYYAPSNLHCLSDTLNHFCMVLRNSFDPNDLQVFPVGETEEHYIENQVELEYLLRYQNMGTDTAFDIRVEHIFSEEFIPSSFSLIESSFDGVQAIIEPDKGIHRIEFLLPEVLLPDDKTNEPGSNGYIRYSLTMANLPELYVHSSFADIFFDYNPPIRTNSVYHTITTDYFYGKKYVALCQGDHFLDIVLKTDTILMDTLNIPGPDSIYEYSVLVEPVLNVNLDTLICPGDVIEFNSRTLFAEGKYTFEVSQQGDCDEYIFLHLIHKKYEEIHIDTAISPGSTFMGDTINNDTTYYEFRETADSCSDVFYHVDLLTSIRQPRNVEGLIHVFPNPTQDHLRIQSYRQGITVIDELRIHNIHGQEILKLNQVKLPKRLNVEDLIRGIYFIHIKHITGKVDVIAFSKT